MTQQGSTVGGSYRCRTGTMMCPQVQRYRRDRVWRGARRWFIAQGDTARWFELHFRKQTFRRQNGRRLYLFAGWRDPGTRSVGGGADLLARARVFCINIVTPNSPAHREKIEVVNAG